MNIIRESRIEKVKEFMRRRELDAVLISNCSIGNWNTWLTASEDIPLHLPYNRNNLCLVSADGGVVELCARIPHPTDWAKFPVITEMKPPECVVNGRIGLVNGTYLKKSVRDYLSEYAMEITDVGNEFNMLKAEKTEAEIRGIKNAAEALGRVFAAIPLVLTNEPLEREAAVRIRNRVREMGAECEDLMSSTALRLTSSKDGESTVQAPLPYPGRRIGYGDRVNINVNAYMPGGFAAALGRTYVLGNPSEASKMYWELSVRIQDIIASHAIPGETISELMDIMKKELEAKGLRLQKGNQIYGIGVSMYEAPRNIDVTRDLPLKAGMTLVIAPIVKPENCDPYCCMDVFVVTENGAERISEKSRELCVLD